MKSTQLFLSLGYGRHACRGCWFAAQTKKQALAYIIMNYNVELIGGPVRRKALLYVCAPISWCHVRAAVILRTMFSRSPSADPIRYPWSSPNHILGEAPAGRYIDAAVICRPADQPDPSTWWLGYECVSSARKRASKHSGIKILTNSEYQFVSR